MNTIDKEKAYIEDAVKKINRFLTCFIIFVIGFGLGIWAGIKYEKKHITSPVERTDIIDSLITENDKIKIKVEKLDSIKDAKVIEVSTLDNDSTVKLFYKLVSE